MDVFDDYGNATKTKVDWDDSKVKNDGVRREEDDYMEEDSYDYEK